MIPPSPVILLPKPTGVCEMNQSYEQLVDSFVNHVVDGMDMDTMVAFVRETLRTEYCNMREQEVYSLIQEHAPHLVDDDAVLGRRRKIKPTGACEMTDQVTVAEMLQVLSQVKEKCQDADRLWQVEELVDDFIRQYSSVGRAFA